LIHRDYFVSAPVRIFVFDDRIEIISPGSLPDHLTVEKIQAGNSIQRNPILTSFIAKGLLPYRGLGIGVRRALEEWPRIKFIDDRDRCLFTSIVERINAPLKIHLSDLQAQILEIFKQAPKISYEELMVKLGKDISTIRRNIRKLKSLRLLRRIGPDKSGAWDIIHEKLTLNISV
jgi:ATP-dependent DNA helicase RecG